MDGAGPVGPADDQAAPEYLSVESVPSDPGLTDQWYLINPTVGELDLNVAPAWDFYTGDGVVVTVIDNGFLYTDDDIDDNYDTATDYDYENGDDDPIVNSSAWSPPRHGTSVVGIIVGEEGNDLGGVGVAYGATVRGYRGLEYKYLADQILDCAGRGDGTGNTNGTVNGGDILSMSFGATSVFQTNADLDATIAALADVSYWGRDWLGQINVKSNGNSRDDPNTGTREEATAEAMDSSKYTISVAALRADRWVTRYSTPGANLLVSAFGDDTSDNTAIYTPDAWSDTSYRSDFGGTSAATPMVSGVVALMLEANPNLGWRDVQMILANSAHHVGSEVGTAANIGAPADSGYEQATQSNGGTWFWNGAETWNGGGLHFSNDYGYGLVDAQAAVRLAESWGLQSTSHNDFEVVNDLDGSNPGTTFDDYSYTYSGTGPANMILEHVSVEIEFTAAWLADLEVFLVSGDGTRVQLIADTGGSGTFDGRWTFGTTAFMGELADGTWSVQILDDQAQTTFGNHGALTITDVDIRFSGRTDTGDDLFIVTNEFSDYAGVAGHGTAFVGGIGTETVNAAAVSDSASTVYLGAGIGTIDGASVTFSSIENFFGGAGDDTIYGSDDANHLFGGWGDDILQGDGGADLLEGGGRAATPWISRATPAIAPSTSALVRSSFRPGVHSRPPSHSRSRRRTTATTR